MLRLIGDAAVERMFWSGAWIDRSVVLAAIARLVRRRRPSVQIALDEGWWENRDLTIDHGSVRLDVQALVEDHGDGRCLCRLRARARLRADAIPLIVALLISMVLAGENLMVWSLGALAAAIVVTRDAVNAWSLLSEAFDGTAAECGVAAIVEAGRVRTLVAAIAKTAGHAASVGMRADGGKRSSATGTY
jgi:hypothetical protein